jgi:hypothetical protein
MSWMTSRGFQSPFGAINPESIKSHGLLLRFQRLRATPWPKLRGPFSEPLSCAAHREQTRALRRRGTTGLLQPTLKVAVQSPRPF